MTRKINLQRIAFSSSLPDYGDLMDTISTMAKIPSEDNINLAKHILSRASLILPESSRNFARINHGETE